MRGGGSPSLRGRGTLQRGSEGRALRRMQRGDSPARELDVGLALRKTRWGGSLAPRPGQAALRDSGRTGELRSDARRRLRGRCVDHADLRSPDPQDGVLRAPRTGNGSGKQSRKFRWLDRINSHSRSKSELSLRRQTGVKARSCVSALTVSIRPGTECPAVPGAGLGTGRPRPGD